MSDAPVIKGGSSKSWTVPLLRNYHGPLEASVNTRGFTVQVQWRGATVSDDGHYGWTCPEKERDKFVGFRVVLHQDELIIDAVYEERETIAITKEQP